MKTFLTAIAALLLSQPSFATEAKAPSATFQIGALEINVVMQAPHLMVAPLQVFGAFRYAEKNDGFSGADLEMDEGFGGLVQELRKEHAFGDLAESLVLNPPKGSIVVPKKVLLMGLGDAESFRPENMERVGKADVRAACALGLKEFSHASDVQDGGVNKFAAGLIAEKVMRGITAELSTQQLLAKRGATAPCKLAKVAYLAGPKFLDDTVASLTKLTLELGGRRIK